MEPDAKIYVAGHRGLVGSALVSLLETGGHSNVVTRTHAELDLTDAAAVQDFFETEVPEFVFLAAARVGGIEANRTYPADFIHTNLAIQTSVIHAAHLANVKRLLFFGSNCTYPKDCPQPMREEYLFVGDLEPTSEAYATAKTAGMRMCQAYNRQHGRCFISVIPATLYGPRERHDPSGGHVLSALLHKWCKAKQNGQERVILWGTGTPRREFLYVDDLAKACLHLMRLDEATLRSVADGSGMVLNAGSGQDVSILDLAALIRDIVGTEAEIVLDKSKPDGALRKLLDSRRMADLGWCATTPLEEGIRKAYEAVRNAHVS